MEAEEGYILLPRPIKIEAIDMVKKEGFKVVIADNDNRSTIIPLMKKAKAVILRTGLEMDQELIEKADDLWTISRTGGGVDNVDLAAAIDKDVIVTSSLGVNATSVAEHCIALVLGLYKQLVFLDGKVRNSEFSIRYQYHPQDIEGKRLGVIGFGRIGQKTADYFQKFSSKKILAYDPIISDEAKKRFENWVDFVDLKELLINSDVITIHVPLNEHTKDLISWDELKLMKAEAFIVNVSRGGILNEEALIKALKHGIIKGAGLDVFEHEPPDGDSPLLKLDNIVLTPHSAALTKECVVRMATEAARRVISVLKGYQPEMVANPEVLSHERWKDLKSR